MCIMPASRMTSAVRLLTHWFARSRWLIASSNTNSELSRDSGVLPPGEPKLRLVWFAEARAFDKKLLISLASPRVGLEDALSLSNVGATKWRFGGVGAALRGEFDRTVRGVGTESDDCVWLSELEKSLSLSSLIEDGEARLSNINVSFVKEVASRKSKSRCLSSQEGSGTADPWRLGSHWVGTASFTSQDWLSALSTLDVRRGSGGGGTPRGSGGGAAFIFQS